MGRYWFDVNGTVCSVYRIASLEPTKKRRIRSLMRPNPVIAHISEYSLENTVFLQAPGPLFQTVGSRCKPWTMEFGRLRGECMECLSPDGRECLFTTSLDIHIREVKSLWVRSRRRGLLCALVQCFAIVVFLHDCQRTETQGLRWETNSQISSIVYALAQRWRFHVAMNFNTSEMAQYINVS